MVQAGKCSRLACVQTGRNRSLMEGDERACERGCQAGGLWAESVEGLTPSPPPSSLLSSSRSPKQEGVHARTREQESFEKARKGSCRSRIRLYLTGGCAKRFVPSPFPPFVFLGKRSLSSGSALFVVRSHTHTHTHIYIYLHTYLFDLSVLEKRTTETQREGESDKNVYISVYIHTS